MPVKPDDDAKNGKIEKKYSILNPKTPIYILILNPKISISVRAIEAVTIHEKRSRLMPEGPSETHFLLSNVDDRSSRDYYRRSRDS